MKDICFLTFRKTESTYKNQGKDGPMFHGFLPRSNKGQENICGNTMKISLDFNCYYQMPLKTVFNERKNLNFKSQAYTPVQMQFFHFLVLILGKTLNHSEPQSAHL